MQVDRIGEDECDRIPSQSPAPQDKPEKQMVEEGNCNEIPHVSEEEGLEEEQEKEHNGELED